MLRMTPLDRFNLGLRGVREEFYKAGRLEDSNAKLEVVSKLLAIEVCAFFDKNSQAESLGSMLSQFMLSSEGIVQRLNASLSRVVHHPLFLDADGVSLFEENARIGLKDSEHQLASQLVGVVVEAFEDHLRDAGGAKTFEFINEAFGHFVRDNFRNNIEDAQYMTPPEVVDYMCEMALQSMPNDGCADRRQVVCDPSCGVGSFLAQFYRHSLGRNDRNRPMLVGQDKVDRMVRLARLNLLLFGVSDAVVARGNSLSVESPIDHFLGECDAVLTNPPFGARYRTSEIKILDKLHFPLLHSSLLSSDSIIDSEVLFLDRYVSLLKPDGVALIVVPDSVVSSNGVCSMMRSRLHKTCRILSITELPAVTFAQAGTRTRTTVLHIKKCPPSTSARVTIAICKDLGFEVSSRKGVPYKKPTSSANELPLILEKICCSNSRLHAGQVEIKALQPSVVTIPQERLTSEAWTPSHHASTRYATLAKLDAVAETDKTQLVRLGDIVEIPKALRRSSGMSVGSRCISVLHVGDFGSLNISELMSYSPKYPGQACQPGDVLFSKINPRIPRALVVPDIGVPLTCSTEFEVMQPKEGRSPYEIMILLLSEAVQAQIRALTSGTSSSHNRIKTEQLLSVMISLPSPRSQKGKELKSIVHQFEEAHGSSISSGRELYESWLSANRILGAS